MEPVTYLELTVGAGDTAAALDPALPAAASTPFLLALVEGACHKATVDDLPPGHVTVGAQVSLEHLAPTPPGRVLRATATLEETQDGRHTWSVLVHEDERLVARARHTRVQVPVAAIEHQLVR